MHPVSALHRLGGVASRTTLVRTASRHAFDRAVRRGEVVRDGHGRYALPTADDALRTANALTGVVSLRSAAAYWGWEQKLPSQKPDVTVPRNRNVPADKQLTATVHWADLAPDDIHRGVVTSRMRTLLDCMRRLPFDEGLAIADSALRHGDISPAELSELADAARGPGAARVRDVARHSDARAENPFESILRATALPVRGLHLVPQLAVRLPSGTIYPDLVDEHLRIVAEADSFAWHGSRGALRQDCRRYNRLVLRGWTVLRFAWEDVMFRPDYVRASLELAVRLAGRRAQRRRTAQKAA